MFLLYWVCSFECISFHPFAWALLTDFSNHSPQTQLHSYCDAFYMIYSVDCLNPRDINCQSFVFYIVSMLIQICIYFKGENYYIWYVRMTSNGQMDKYETKSKLANSVLMRAMLHENPWRIHKSSSTAENMSWFYNKGIWSLDQFEFHLV